MTKNTYLMEVREWIAKCLSDENDENKSELPYPGGVVPRRQTRVCCFSITSELLRGQLIYYSNEHLENKQCLIQWRAPLTKLIVEWFLIRHPAMKTLNSLEISTEFKKQINPCFASLSDDQLIQSLKLPFRELPFTSHSTVKGKKRTLEDRYAIFSDFNTVFGLDLEPISLFTVFDGHRGAEVAQFGAAQFPVLLAEELASRPDKTETALRNVFRKLDEVVEEKARNENINSGSTAVAVVLRPHSITVAWLGDSPAYLLRAGKLLPLIKPHEPSREDEQARIEGLGGFVHDARVNGILGVSRSIGDIEFKPYVSAEPDVMELKRETTDEWLLLATDGLLEGLDPEQIPAIVGQVTSQSEAKSAADRLMQEALPHSSDNVTAVLVFLKPF